MEVGIQQCTIEFRAIGYGLQRFLFRADRERHGGPGFLQPVLKIVVISDLSSIIKKRSPEKVDGGVHCGKFALPLRRRGCHFFLKAFFFGCARMCVPSESSRQRPPVQIPIPQPHLRFGALFDKRRAKPAFGGHGQSRDPLRFPHCRLSVSPVTVQLIATQPFTADSAPVFYWSRSLARAASKQGAWPFAAPGEPPDPTFFPA